MSEKYQVAVIGSGSGGSEAALLAAEKGFQVIIIEKDAFGGTRFHRGCYAVRALHASSRLFREIVKSRRFGIETDLLRSSFLDWSKAQRAASARLAEELRKGLEQLNVRIAAGTGSLLSEHRVRITSSLGNHEDIEAEYIILANGSRPDGYPVITHPDGEEISPGLVLVATGRRPNVESI